jgi:DNA topoisomerase-1
MDYLLIVESPSKCPKIESFIGYKCIASNGHIRTLDGLKNIDVANNYCPKFSIINDKVAHVAKMRSIINKYDKANIILATDDDREGEAIAWHICQVFDLPVATTKRIVFHEITENAVRKAFANQRTIQMDIVSAQFARQVLDVLIGFRCSPILWKYLYNNKDNGLSAGRCQTPALMMVYDEHMKPTVSKPTTYNLTGYFTTKNIDFVAELGSENQVQELLAKTPEFKHLLEIGSPRLVQTNPPKPFNTSSLLQSASSQLHMSPKETMAACQILYQEGHITYMRTENQKYAKEFVQAATKFIETKFGERYVGDTSLLSDDNTIVSENPHEAIRITHMENQTVSKHTGKTAALYKLIWTNTMESLMPIAKHTKTDCFIKAPDGVLYKRTIDQTVFDGWRKVGSKMLDETGILTHLKTLGSLIVSYNTIKAVAIVRRENTAYTEANLVQRLENAGIGRPSTFASIVETIQERAYVKKKDIEGTKIKQNEYTLVGSHLTVLETEKVVGSSRDKLIIEPVGIVIAEFLRSHFNELFSYDYTSKLENLLDKATAENWHLICADCDALIQSQIKPIQKAKYAIDENHDMIFTRNGPVIKDNTTSELVSVSNEVSLDIGRLKSGEYTLDELKQEKSRVLGSRDGHQVVLHNGRFGAYAQWDTNKVSIKKPFSQITMDDIVVSEQSNGQSKNILRVINDEYSVRKGKFGPYMYYKRADMAKPEFYNMKSFRESFSHCSVETLLEWIKSREPTPNVIAEKKGGVVGERERSSRQSPPKVA